MPLGTPSADDGDIPFANRPGTLRGFVVTFMVLAGIAVCLRMYVRIKDRLWGYDDLSVLLASVSIGIGSVVTCFLPSAGMGRHFWTLNEGQIVQFYKHVWSTNVSYTASTALIKLSILVQYLRLFNRQDRSARMLTWAMIGLISCWGITFFCLALFSCQPIKKNWQYKIPGKCVGWGSKSNPSALFAPYAAHSASNMALDIFVFVLPLPFLKNLSINGKAKVGLVSLFIVGGIVVSIATARMISLAQKRAGTVPIFDPTFVTPLIYIFSVLEVTIAIICASIPIFWPLVVSLATNKILVVQEIEIRTDRRTSQAAHHGNGEGFEDNGGRHSRMSTLVHHPDLKPARMNSRTRTGRSNSRARYGHRQKPSSSSSINKRMGVGIELGHRVSHESQRSLAHHDSTGSLSHTGSPGAEPFDTSRTGSLTNYQDRYVQEWVCPDFGNKEPGAAHSARGHMANAEKAEMPYDHLRALEK